MNRFIVPDMSCSHCEATIRKAVAEVDASARVDVDLARHLVTIDSPAASAPLASAIRNAGYTPQPA